MTLELKHLASYLPYELKVVEVNKEKIVSDEFIIDACAFSVGMVGSSTQLDSFELERSFRLTHIKPILRPLSDLTKEIDGVVHLVELAKIQCEYDILDYKLQSNVINGISAFGINYINNDDESMVFGYDTYNGFGLHIKPMCDILFVSNQLKLYEYLFQHHFDVYGLIEKRLAIDVNTIENV